MFPGIFASDMPCETVRESRTNGVEKKGNRGYLLSFAIVTCCKALLTDERTRSRSFKEYVLEIGKKKERKEVFELPNFFFELGDHDVFPLIYDFAIDLFIRYVPFITRFNSGLQVGDDLGDNRLCYFVFVHKPFPFTSRRPPTYTLCLRSFPP
jgi:hypothetical protein